MKRRTFLQAVVGLLGLAGFSVERAVEARRCTVSGLPQRFYVLRRAADPGVDGWDQFEVTDYGKREEFVGFVSDQHLMETGMTPEEDLLAWASG